MAIISEPHVFNCQGKSCCARPALSTTLLQVLPAVALILFCIYVQIATATIILATQLSKDEVLRSRYRPLALLIGAAIFISAIWQTMEAWFKAPTPTPLLP